MMNVSIDTDGTGVVTLPGQSVPITAADSNTARAQAVEVLVAYTATTGRRQYAHAIDAGVSLMLTIDPDGAVTVDRRHARTYAPANEPTADEELAQPIREIVDELPATSATLPDPVVDTAPAPHIDPDFNVTGSGEGRLRVPSAMITFDDGSAEIIRGTTLLGRRPPKEAEGVDATVTVDDPARSVSRSHCILSFRDGMLWVTDQSSANGTTVTEHGKEPIDIPAGHPRAVVTGTRLQIGDRSFTVTIPAPSATGAETVAGISPTPAAGLCVPYEDQHPALSNLRTPAPHRQARSASWYPQSGTQCQHRQFPPTQSPCLPEPALDTSSTTS